MALAHFILVTHNCVEVVQGAASCHTVGDTQTNHDNQLRWHDDPLAQLRSCKSKPQVLRRCLSGSATSYSSVTSTCGCCIEAAMHHDELSKTAHRHVVSAAHHKLQHVCKLVYMCVLQVNRCTCLVAASLARGRDRTKCILSKLMVSVESATIHLMHLHKLPQGVQRDDPGKDQNNNACWPAQVRHGRRKTKHAGTDDSSYVVESRVPPAIKPAASLCRHLVNGMQISRSCGVALVEFVSCAYTLLRGSSSSSKRCR